MEICDRGHDEIVFDRTIYCPLCQANKEIERLEDRYREVADLNDGYVADLDDKEGEIESLKDELDELAKSIEEKS